MSEWPTQPVLSSDHRNNTEQQAKKGGEQASKVEGTMPASKREEKDAKGAQTDTRQEKE